MSSFSEETLREKLTKVNDTQASIVGLSQWVLFHYRHADKIAQTWKTCLEIARENRILVLVYVANDVIQQARARRKIEFMKEFEKVFSESLAPAYARVSSGTIRFKIKRSVKVWRERKVVEESIVDEILKQFDEIDADSNVKPGEAGGSNNSGKSSSSSSSEKLVTDLHGLNKQYSKLQSHNLSLSKDLEKFNTSFDELFTNDLSSPNIFLNEIQGLLKSYNSHKARHENTIHDRNNVIKELERLLDLEKKALAASTFDKYAESNGLAAKHTKMMETTKELEQMILEDGEGVKHYRPESDAGGLEEVDEDEVPTYLSDSEEEKDLESDSQRELKGDSERDSKRQKTDTNMPTLEEEDANTKNDSDDYVPDEDLYVPEEDGHENEPQTSGNAAVDAAMLLQQLQQLQN